MHPIPRTPLLLGLAGVIPFVWGALTLLSPAAADFGISVLGPRFIGPYVQLFYGAIILSFMSGVLWGFATKAESNQAATGYVLSVIPALWAFFMTGNGPVSASLNLIIGFVGLLLIDFSFWTWGLAPQWWMSLRILLTAIVVACLGLTAYL
ncbi:DUF3429 domain-containing protein [uncultured Sulfitobacter sp.]|uniref:DUF3429 domain-containing protein n=1 Tax=uncultured Sulfitobacter sp. TaxID=191468 RepID=UPI00261A010D|nr:DUF3429 domain-containing protein [uncultured Sulfitobacter sp.]